MNCLEHDFVIVYTVLGLYQPLTYDGLRVLAVRL